MSKLNGELSLPLTRMRPGASIDVFPFSECGTVGINLLLPNEAMQIMDFSPEEARKIGLALIESAAEVDKWNADVEAYFAAEKEATNG